MTKTKRKSASSTAAPIVPDWAAALAKLAPPDPDPYRWNEEGNDKIGDRAVIANRAVGDTCPPCEWLNNGCYAQRSEVVYPQVRPRGLINSQPHVLRWQTLRAMMLTAARTHRAVRFHERGDFFRTTKTGRKVIDRQYIDDICLAADSITAQRRQLPEVWLYTHVYSRYLVEQLSARGFKVYASVSNTKQLAQAQRNGFTLFAWSDAAQHFAKKTHKIANRAHVPNYVTIQGERFLTCPEQRKGRDRVTCTGTESSTACRYCPQGLGNVLFLAH
jgi:hypothetical protein